MVNPFKRFFGSKGAVSSDQNKNSKDGPNEVTLHIDESGSSGTQIYGGYIQDDYLEKMNGVQRSTIFDQMRRADYQVIMLLAAVKNLLMAADFDIEAADIPEGETDEELIKYILFENMDSPWVDFLAECFTFIDFGYSLFEVVHKVVTGDPKFKNFIGIRKLAWRNPRTIYQWNIDKQTETLKSVTQIGYGDAGKMDVMDAAFLLLFNYKKEGANFEGVSLLRGCFGPWSRKNNYLKLNAAGIEKFAIPTPTAEVPDGKQGTPQFANLVKALKAYTSHQKNYLTYPSGWKIDLKGNNGFDPKKIEFSVDCEDKRMAKTFLATFLELGLHGSGSHALSSNLSDFFLSGLEFLGKEVCNKMNGLIKDMIILNKGPRKAYPIMKCTGISDKAGKELADVLKSLGDGKYIIPDNDLEDFLRNRYQLTPRSENGQRISANPSPNPNPNSASFYERVQFARWKQWQIQK